MKRLGLIGGTSWVSSEHYYRRLNLGVAEALGGSHSAPVTLWSSIAGRWNSNMRQFPPVSRC